MNKKGFIGIGMIAAIVALLIIVGGAMLFSKSNGSNKVVDNNANVQLDVQSNEDAQSGQEDFKPTSGIVFVSNLGIYYMDENGGNTRRLSPKAEQNDREPSVSPDGTKITFTNTDGGGASLWVMNIDGTGRIMVFDGSGGGDNTTITPTWSPDGKKIYYAKSFGSKGGSFIFSINADGTGDEQVSPLYPNKNGANAGDSSPSVSPDGKKIAFITQRLFPSTVSDVSGVTSFMSGVTIMNTDGSGMKVLETGKWNNIYHVYDSFPRPSYSVSWSPDGSKIAYSAVAVEEPSQIYVMNSDGTGIIKLTSDKTADSYDPSWSPDGTKIVFWKECSISPDGTENPLCGGNNKIYVMNADGSSQKELPIQTTDTAQGIYPSFIGKPR